MEEAVAIKKVIINIGIINKLYNDNKKGILLLRNAFYKSYN